MDSDAEQKPEVVIVPSLGMGHLIPFLEISKRLASLHAFHITFVTTNCNLSPPQIPYARNYLAPHNLPIRLVDLPQIHLHPHKMKPVTLKSKVTEKSTGLLENLLREINPSKIRAFVTDMFNTAFLDVAAKLNIPAYLFVSSPASYLNFMFHMPTLDSHYEGSFKDMDFLVEVPVLGPMDPKDFPSSVQDKSDECYDFYVKHCRNLSKAKGILINTFRDLESDAVRYLKTGFHMPSVHPVGPIITFPDEGSDGSGCLEWLNLQPPRSVVLVSFGSEAFLSAAQIREVAHGLEASGQHFLLVLRGTSDSELEPAQVLPEGFESRTAGRGRVVYTWMAQMSVLSHPSTGAFVCHCGWNSTLESIWCGVPIVAWPLQAEQKMNRHLLVNMLGTAIAVKVGPDGLVGRDEVERVSREIMAGGEEGNEVRKRTTELQKSAHSTVGPGGSSYDSLLAVVSEWKKNATL